MAFLRINTHQVRDSGRKKSAVDNFQALKNIFFTKNIKGGNLVGHCFASLAEERRKRNEKINIAVLEG